MTAVTGGALPWWAEDELINKHIHVLRMTTHHPPDPQVDEAWRVVGKCRCGNFRTPPTCEADVMQEFNAHMVAVQTAVHFAAKLGQAVLLGVSPPAYFLAALVQASGPMVEPTYGPPSATNG